MGCRCLSQALLDCFLSLPPSHFLLYKTALKPGSVLSLEPRGADRLAVSGPGPQQMGGWGRCCHPGLQPWSLQVTQTTSPSRVRPAHFLTLGPPSRPPRPPRSSRNTHLSLSIHSLSLHTVCTRTSVEKCVPQAQDGPDFLPLAVHSQLDGLPLLVAGPVERTLLRPLGFSACQPAVSLCALVQPRSSFVSDCSRKTNCSLRHVLVQVLPETKPQTETWILGASSL